MDRDALAMEEEEDDRVDTISDGSARHDSTPPRLFFYPLRSHRPEPLGMQTPPLRPPGSIPFRWEEAPGKPKKHLGSEPVPLVPCLALPPHLPAAVEAKKTAATPMRFSPSFADPSPSCYSFPLIMMSRSSSESRGGSERKYYRVWQWKREKESTGLSCYNDAKLDMISPSSSSSSSSSSSELQSLAKLDKRQISRLGRSKSVDVGFSSSTNHYSLGGIYWSLKQLGLWRRERKM